MVAMDLPLGAVHRPCPKDMPAITQALCGPLALLLLSSCADPLVYPEEVTLLGTEIHEVCALMWGGQDIEVAFETNDLVSFDLHVHAGTNAEVDPADYLIGPEPLTGAVIKTFEVADTGEYCLQWHNEAQHALRVRYQVSYSTPP